MDNEEKAFYLQLCATASGGGPTGSGLNPITDRIPITLQKEGDNWLGLPGKVSLTSRETPSVCQVFADRQADTPITTLQCGPLGHLVDGGFVFDNPIVIEADMLAAAGTEAVATNAAT